MGAGLTIPRTGVSFCCIGCSCFMNEPSCAYVTLSGAKGLPNLRLADFSSAYGVPQNDKFEVSPQFRGESVSLKKPGRFEIPFDYGLGVQTQPVL